MQYRSDTYAANTFNTFYFEKNLQGDVVAVYTENGVKVLSYTYDAWGNHTTTWHNSYGINMYAIYAAWDLKTGSATLSPSRIAKMQVAIGQPIPIFQIR